LLSLSCLQLLRKKAMQKAKEPAAKGDAELAPNGTADSNGKTPGSKD
jgi:hypothetical protein